MPIELSESNVVAYLRERLPGVEATARCEAAGDGNINWVRRVRDARGSWVVKQARGRLEKFPEYAAPPERVLHEARYYERVAEWGAPPLCPALLHLDRENHVLVLEDLGDAERLDTLWARGEAAGEALVEVTAFLGAVHARSRDAGGLDAFPDGEADKHENEGDVLQLHLAHIFRLPFEANDFPLSPAVRERGQKLRSDLALLGRIGELETQCRRRGTALIHGDVQPTNLLVARSERTGRGRARVLDAETAHAGAPAFDLGMLFAQLAVDDLARHDFANVVARVTPLWDAYCDAAGAAACPFAEVSGVTGVEVLRRTLGAARMPGVERDALALRAVELGSALVRDMPASPAAWAGLA